MATHYSKDGKDAYQIKREHPECPYSWAVGAKHMTTARIDFETAQDRIIEWYEITILGEQSKSKPKSVHQVYRELKDLDISDDEFKKRLKQEGFIVSKESLDRQHEIANRISNRITGNDR